MNTLVKFLKYKFSATSTNKKDKNILSHEWLFFNMKKKNVLSCT